MRTHTHLVLGAVAALALGLTACGDDDDAGGTDATTEATEEGAATEVTEGEEPTEETSAATEPEGGGEPADTSGESATVNLATDEEFGDYLVDEQGLTLYVFTQDEGTDSACTSDQCMDAWPPIATDEPTAGDGVDA